MPTVSRRAVLAGGAVAAVGAVSGPGALRALALEGPALLDAATVPKYRSPLLVPPAMPASSTGDVDRYVIGVRQIRQQVLPAGLPTTTVWAFGSETTAGTHHAPSLTVEARVDHPVEVTWANRLVQGRTGRYLPHLLPVDPTLHWANPGGGPSGRDGTSTFTTTPGPYRGPVPFVVHLHGGHADEESDGYPESWFLPDSRSIPAGYALVGSHHEAMAARYADRHGATWAPGTQRAHYGNDQPAGTLWFHDHTLGITRLNVYAGPAGFYLLRGGPHDLPPGVLPTGHSPAGSPLEIPLAIQDRTFRRDGELHYPGSRADFDGFAGPYVPDSDIAPIWNPEVFGTTIIVNGRTWPELRVERRRYRLRLLNGCTSRFLLLSVAADPEARPAQPALPLWQVGGDVGFLRQPVALQRVLLAPAERADVVVDFTGVPAGTVLHLVNEAPDEPFGGGEPGVDFEGADPATTGQVLRFAVVDASGPDTSVPPEQLSLPTPPALPPELTTRALALVEADSAVLPDVGPRAAFLGTMAGSVAVPLGGHDAPTERPGLGDTEVWELHNHTADAHPVHVHQVRFEVVDRRSPGTGWRPPEPGETGPKDTVVAYPGEVTRLRARFDKPGLFVWHCHILEHEDHEMMRPFVVG